MLAAEVNGQGSTFESGAIHSLFSTHAAVQEMSSAFAVSADGKSFLVDSVPDTNAASITIVVHWSGAAQRGMAGDGH
jgi:hypothetical protein